MHSAYVCLCSQLQGKLHRLEAQLERWYVESENCQELVEGCGCELEKLAEEKQRLTERIETIDQDMKQVGGQSPLWVM